MFPVGIWNFESHVCIANSPPGDARRKTMNLLRLPPPPARVNRQSRKPGRKTMRKKFHVTAISAVDYPVNRLGRPNHERPNNIINLLQVMLGNTSHWNVVNAWSEFDIEKLLDKCHCKSFACQGPAKARLWCPWFAVCCQLLSCFLLPCFFLCTGGAVCWGWERGGPGCWRNQECETPWTTKGTNVSFRYVSIAIVLLLVSYLVELYRHCCVNVYTRTDGTHRIGTQFVAEVVSRCNLMISDMSSDCEVKTTQWRHQRGGVGMVGGRDSKRTMSIS